MHQEFLRSKTGKLKKKISADYVVQAPLIWLVDVFRYWQALLIPIYRDDSIINTVPTGRLVMAVPRPPASEIFLTQSKGQSLRVLAAIQVNGITEDFAKDDGSPELPRTGISCPMTHGRNLTIYPRIVEAKDAMQLTKDLVADVASMLSHGCNCTSIVKPQRISTNPNLDIGMVVSP